MVGRMAAVVSIRPATPEDADEIARLHTGTWQTAYRGIVPDAALDALSWQDRASQWRESLGGGGAASVTTLVAIEEDRLVGFAAVGPVRDDDIPAEQFDELYAIYVLPGSWRRGIGTRLLGEATMLAGATGRGLVLWVLARNELAQDFYASTGWRPDGATGHHHVGGARLPVIRFRRPLD
jgi:GNAT superfamily N-acetyltransferase